MKKKNVGKSILQWLFDSYMKLLERTVNICWCEENQYGASQIYGFWHEDSFLMMLVLGRLCHKTTPVDVIVTADTRGDYIEHMINRNGGEALRVPDGYRSFGALRKIVQDCYEKDRSVAVALDGPLGPRHEPKKLAFYLSEHAEEDFVGISITYSSCVRLAGRWDKYAIPLPFSTILVAITNYGVVRKSEVPELPFDAGAIPDQTGVFSRNNRNIQKV